ncbi:Starch-binding associating with outer membrane [Chishuiella changwenlii]|uniref:Starch-binding associating with outer membrane n=1 Tax=Chishuiella changwenlii TaxID=1434701 RepID=A0A1M6TQ96_9FLAO|nr:SusD/RagB family nutrient-binding outer membrane lipoprotein [Chishuiella changwenlii]GGF03970.1 hypothetical protein GCM10010984_21610 [Chishuiella changwenlii]SHK59106.1 Starch-binding associating with outer membrane [Chishuiella changwenlii]
MKIIQFILTIFITGMLFSCESDLDEINTNPNDPSHVSPALLLTNISRTTFQAAGKDPLFASRMIILTSGENVFQYFKWNQGSYSRYETLMQAEKMIEEAKLTNNNNYIAIAKFFKAYHFYNLTVMFGEIPYSEALKGESSQVFNPKYDSQEAVFTGVLKELEEANNLINTNDAISGDIIYNGNTTKWKKLINAFRLRVLMTLSNKGSINGNSVASQFSAIVQNQNLMSSSDDNAQLVFFDRLDNRYTSFNDSDYGSSIYMSGSYIKLFQERKDPRLFSFAERTGQASSQGLALTNFNGYNGGDPIVPYANNEALVQQQNISKVNQRFYRDAINEPHSLLSYSEQELILAEAAARGWISSGAKNHYENSIKASFDFYSRNSPNASTYFADFDVNNYLIQDLVNFDRATNLNAQLELIMTQRYLSAFHQQGWNFFFDYLRTNYPNLPIQTGTAKPYRFLYPTSEYNNNTTNLQESISRQFNGTDNINLKTWLYN